MKPKPGEIRLEPKVVEHCLRLGMVQSGILTASVAKSAKIYCYRHQSSGEQIGAKVTIKLPKIS